MNAASEEAKELAKNAESAEVDLKKLKVSENGSRLATIGLTLATTALNVALSMGISFAIQGVISRFTEWSEASKRAAEAAKEASESANELKDSFTNLDEYKDKINSLNEALDTGNLSQSEAREKREELMSIQEELIKKYGGEKDAIDNITNAIKGEKDALDELKAAEAKDWNKSHDSEISNAESFFSDVVELNVDWGFYTSGRKYNATAEEVFKNWYKDNQSKISFLTQYDGYITNIKFKGTRDQIVSYYDDLYDYLNDYLKQNAELISDDTKQQLSMLRTSVSDARNYILNGKDNNDDYNTNKNVLNTASENALLSDSYYNSLYKKYQEKIKAYNDALLDDDKDRIEKMYDDVYASYTELSKEITYDVGNVKSSTIKNWLNDYQKKINSSLGNIPLLKDIRLSLKNPVTDVSKGLKEAIGNMSELTTKEWDEIFSGKYDNIGSYKGISLDYIDAVKNFIDYYNDVAKATGDTTITTNEFVDALEELGYIQGETNESFSEFSITKYQDELDTLSKKLETLKEAYKNISEGKFTEEKKLTLISDKDSGFPELEEYINNIGEGIEKIAGDKIDTAINKLKEIDISKLDDNELSSYNHFIDYLLDLKSDFNDASLAQEKFRTELDNTLNRIKALVSMRDEIKKNGKLSVESTKTILSDDRYKSLWKDVKDGNIESYTKGINNLINAEKKNFGNLANSIINVDFGQNIKKIKDEIKRFEQLYGIDLNNWEDLSDDKKEELKETNAELLKKQKELINEFNRSYNIDLTSFKSWAEAKTAIMNGLRIANPDKRDTLAAIRDEVLKRNPLAITNDSQGSVRFHIEENSDTYKYLNDKLKRAGYTYDDFIRYVETGLSGFTDAEINNKISEVESVFGEVLSDLADKTNNVFDNFEIDESLDTTKSTSEAKQYFDWVERKLKRLSDYSKEIYSNVVNFTTFNGKNGQLSSAINAVEQEIVANQQAYNTYLSFANSLGLSGEYQNMVQNGLLIVEQIKDSDLRDKIQQYQTYYDKAQSCLETVRSLKETEKSYAKEMLSNVDKYFDNRIQQAKYGEEYQNSVDTENRFIHKNYSSLRDSYNKQIDETQNKAANLQSTLNSLVSRGLIQYGNSDWYEWVRKIDECTISVNQLRKSTRDLANEELQDVKDFWDNYISVIDNDIKELENQNKDSTRATNMDYDGLKNDYRVKLSYLKKEADELNARLNSAVSNGDIEKYSDKWYEWKNKISDCKNEVIELRTSLHELDIEFLNERKTFWENRLDRIESNINKQTAINENSDRIDNIGTVIDKLYNLNKSKKIELERELINLRNEFQKLDIQKYSKEWYEWQKIFEDLEVEIINVDNSISDLSDTLRDIPIDRMKYVADIISKMRTLLKDVHSLHEAQGYEKTANEIYQVINSGQEQIEALSQEAVNIVFKMSNGLYGKEGSKQWKEALEEVVNIYESIYSVQIEQEQEYDKLIDLEINALNKQKEQLQEQNSELEKKLSLEKAIESLERARYQKNKLIYREGVGFVYEEDKNAVRDAQQELDNQYHQQVLDYFDKAVEALQEFKKNHNVYDYKGTQFSEEAYNDNSLKTNKYIHGNRKYNLIENTLFKTLPNASDLYKSLFSSDISNIVTQTQTDLLKKSINGFTNNFANNRQNAGTVLNLNIEKGAITLHDVNDVQSLSKAIINQFPLQVMQDINKKR